MTEEEDVANWIVDRRHNAPGVEADLGHHVMERVRAMAAVPTRGERIGSAVRRLVPERRRELVYLGGSAFAGALRVTVILCLVLGVY